MTSYVARENTEQEMKFSKQNCYYF